MTDKIEEAINNLHKVLNEELASNSVAFTLFISSSEVRQEVHTRTPHQLISSGISMKNIKGEWIK